MNICFAIPKGASCDKYYSNKRLVSFLPCRDIDMLVLFRDADLSKYKNCNINTCIFQGENSFLLSKLPRVKSAISCGMREIDSVTFSSIGEEKAFICIRRRLSFLTSFYDPCEFPSPFNRNFSVYHNLVLGLIDFILKDD